VLASLVVLVEGIARLVNARVVTVGKIQLASSTGPQRTVVLANRGWSSEIERRSWYEKVVVRQEYVPFITFQRFASLQGGLITLSREQLADDPEWYRSEEYNEVNRAYGVDDSLCSHLRLKDPVTLQGFHIHRVAT
jgi:hypothetical protein